MAAEAKTTHARLHAAPPRRLVGLERHYRCDACGNEHSSWSRVRSCPRCRAPLAVAVIRRAALAAAL